MQTLESLKSIFKNRLFKIPDYQRGYAWRERQLKDFWEDLVNLPPERYHYTGLITIKPLDKKHINSEAWDSERWLIRDQAYQPFHIVDGQQRITTFIIFINEFLNLIKALPENKSKRDQDIFIGTFTLKQIKEEYIVIQMPPQYIVNSYKFGYERDNPGFKYLRHNILGEPEGGHIIETFYTLNLEGAKEFFCDNLRKHFLDYGLVGVVQLFKKATQNLMFNLHEIEDDFDVYVAFETMNNRGKKLSNLELLKNRLIYLTTIYEDYEIKEDERFILRNEINDAWKDVYFQLGRNKQRPLSDDDFLMAHWIMYFQYTRKKGSDYVRFLLEEKFTPQNVYLKSAHLDSVVQVNEIRDDTEEEDQTNNSEENGMAEQETRVARLTPREISDYVKSLKAAAGHWYNTFHPLNNQDLTSKEQLWLDRLNRIGIAYFRPLVVASYLNKEIGLEDRLRCLRKSKDLYS